MYNKEIIIIVLDYVIDQTEKKDKTPERDTTLFTLKTIKKRVEKEEKLELTELNIITTCFNLLGADINLKINEARSMVDMYKNSLDTLKEELENLLEYAKTLK